MIIYYKNQKLVKYKEKSGGKNKGDIDGFYHNPQVKNSPKYFIKQPQDKKELFTELFAGLLLKEFIERGFVEKRYHASLICADVVEVKKGSYALIQNVASFKELFKIINTGYRDNSDRDPLFEALAGPSYYPMLTQCGKYFGLSTALMFSMLLNAQSVHSGNVVQLDSNQPTDPKQFARLDWGDAFRHICDQDNNEDVLWPKEYHGTLNFKGLTKGYILNYKNIFGLFPQIGKKGKLLLSKFRGNGNSAILSIVKSALAKIPSDLLGPKSQLELAGYLGSSTFAKVTFGEKNGFDDFAKELSDVLKERLIKISELKDLVKQYNGSNKSLYESVVIPSFQKKPFPDKEPTIQASLLSEWFVLEYPSDYSKNRNVPSSSERKMPKNVKQDSSNTLGVKYNNENKNLLAKKEEFNQLHELKSKVDTQKQEMKAVRESLQKLETLNQSFISAQKEASKETHQLKQQLSIKQNKIDNLNKSKSQLEKQLTKLQKTVEFHKESSKITEQTTQQLKSQLENANERLIETQKQLDCKLLGIIELKESEKKMKSENTQLIQEKKDVANTAYQLRNELGSKNEKILKLTQQIHTLEEENSLIISVKKETHEKILQLKQQLELKQNKIFLLKRDNSRLNKSISELRKQLAKEKEKLKLEKTSSKKLEQETQRLRNALKSVHEKTTKTQQKLDDKLNEINSLKALHKNEIDSKQKEIYLHTREMEKLEAGYKTLITSQKEASEKIIKLQKQLKQNEVDFQHRIILSSNPKDKMTRIEQVSPLLVISEQIKALAHKEFSSTSIEYSHAMSLSKQIREKSSQYLKDSKYQLGTFQQELTDIYNDHKTPLENYRGMGYLFGNLALAILLLGVGYLVAASVHKMMTGSFSFFNDTACRKELRSLDEKITSLAQPPVR